ncbi:MAG: hypothetical protein JRG69_07780 [Deltaproteobacteria bacterium]|nr:hypothetical protein [Deltaproteobacteria bacterium]
MMCTDISLIPSYSRGVNIMGRPAGLVTGEVPSALQHELKKLTKEARWGQERYENNVEYALCSRIITEYYHCLQFSIIMLTFLVLFLE